MNENHTLVKLTELCSFLNNWISVKAMHLLIHYYSVTVQDVRIIECYSNISKLHATSYLSRYMYVVRAINNENCNNYDELHISY